MFPCKGFRIAIGAGNDRDKNEAVEFFFQGFIDIVGLEQTIMGVDIEINADLLLEG